MSEEPLPTPHQDKMRQAAFSSGQARYSTAHGAPIQVVSLSVALMLAKQLEDAERAVEQRPEVDAPTYAHLDQALTDATGSILSQYAADKIRGRAVELTKSREEREFGPDGESKRNG